MGETGARMVISEKAHAECVRLLELLTNKRVQESWSWVFMSPVAGIPGYHEVIKKPMDLGTVKKNLGSKPSRCRFKTHEKFAKDVRLVFQNALVYNKDDEQVKGSVYDAAQHLLRVFENAYTKAKETVFKDEDDAAAEHNSSTNEEPDGAGDKEKHASHHHHHHHHGHHHSSSHSSSEHEGGASSSSSKHKKDKSSKKEKKSKKSKKKSKDKDRDREKDRSKDKDRGREKKSSSSTSSSHAAATDDGGHRKSHGDSTGSSSRTSSSSLSAHASGSNDRDAEAAAAPAAASSAVREPSAAKVDKPKVVVVASTPAASSAGTSADANGSKMSEETMAACLSVLMKLIKYKEGNVSPAAPFLQPVDLMHFPDYKVKVPNRMHLYGVQKKLRSGGYAALNAFAFDVRLIFSNCLVYNSDVVLSKVIRAHAVTLMKLFETQFAKIGGTWPGIPDRWKCHQIIHEILANRTDGLETAQWFKYPVETYYDSPDQVPYGYFKKIKHPMDLGTVCSKLHLGVYVHVAELLQDLKLIFDNCVRYWGGDPHGVTYCESAKKLMDVLRTQSSAVFSSQVVEKVLPKEKSSKSSAAASSSTLTSAVAAPAVAAPSATTTTTVERKSSSSSKSAAAGSSSAHGDEERSRKRSAKHISSNFPEKEVCMEIVKALRLHKMKGYHGIEILTAGPFLHAVDVTKYPDYLKIVSEPMDFAKIERKLKGDRYSDVNEFSADVHLIFSNCHKYNSDPVEGADIRAMASNLRDYFVDLYNEKFGTGEKASARSGSTASATPKLAVLPSAKLEASGRADAGAARLLSPKANKKAPLPSPPKQPAAAGAMAPAPAAKPASASSSVAAPASAKASSSTTSGASASSSVAVPPASSASASASSSSAKISTSQMTPQELEEYKKKKKERKEKKDKKEKKKKDKKEKKKKDKDKEKDKDRKDKKDKDKAKSSRSRESEASSSSTTAKTSVPVAPVVAPALPSKATVAVVPVAAPTRVASKISPAETSAGSSKSKTKKSKKSELTGWEASAERVLNRLVKIEQVTKLHFDKPLLEVFPQLEHDYRRLVHEPIDLRTLRDKLQGHSLSPAEFTRLGRLIFQNAIKFNCAADPASAHVREMSGHLLWYFDSLCAEQKLSDASNAAAKLESLRRERAELVASTPMEVKAKECQKLLRVLNSQKYDKNCWPFRKSVRILFPTLPAEYYEIIKTPMDLATIAEKLAAFEYKLHGEFIRDVRLTFENAIRYNHADKDREGWNVYAAAAQMLAVVEEQWCDATLEVVERVRRREIVRKERERLGEKRKGDKRVDSERKSSSSAAATSSHARSSSAVAADSGSHKSKSSHTSHESVDTSLLAKANVTIAPPSSKDDPESSTKIKLIVNRQNLDRMNKSERKAEEKRRKRARREEEMARSEKRRRTAVAATDDALREAEVRSRRRLQKLDIAEAVKQREERERQAREEDAAKSLATKMKFNAAAWTGALAASGQSFWLRKPTKLQVPTAFLAAAVDSY